MVEGEEEEGVGACGIEHVCLGHFLFARFDHDVSSDMQVKLAVVWVVWTTMAPMVVFW